jgi:hypothetical protein
LPNNPRQETFLFLEKVAQNALPASLPSYCCRLSPQADSSAMELVLAWLKSKGGENMAKGKEGVSCQRNYTDND